MKKELKEKIDGLWLPSQYGKWCIAIADEDVEKAKTIEQQIFDSGYPMMEVLENELATELAKVFQTESQVDEYLQILEEENSSLVGVIIQHELFAKVSDLINK